MRPIGPKLPHLHRKLVALLKQFLGGHLRVVQVDVHVHGGLVDDACVHHEPDALVGGFQRRPQVVVLRVGVLGLGHVVEGLLRDFLQERHRLAHLLEGIRVRRDLAHVILEPREVTLDRVPVNAQFLGDHRLGQAACLEPEHFHPALEGLLGRGLRRVGHQAPAFAAGGALGFLVFSPLAISLRMNCKATAFAVPSG